MFYCNVYDNYRIICLALLDIVAQKRNKLFDISQVKDFEKMIKGYNVKTFVHIMHIIVSFIYPIASVYIYIYIVLFYI